MRRPFSEHPCNSQRPPSDAEAARLDSADRPSDAFRDQPPPRQVLAPARRTGWFRVFVQDATPSPVPAGDTAPASDRASTFRFARFERADGAYVQRDGPEQRPDPRGPWVAMTADERPLMDADWVIRRFKSAGNAMMALDRADPQDG